MTKPYETAQTFIGGPMDARKRDLLTRYMYGDRSMTAGERAWCADFTNASLARSGVAGTGSPMARSFLGWGDPTNTPREGDVAVMTRGNRHGPFGHVGFYAGPGDTPGTIKVLGGNQGPGGVNVSQVPTDRVLGFRQIPQASKGLEDVPGSGLPSLSLLPPRDRPYAPSPLKWDAAVAKAPRSPGPTIAEAPRSGGWQWPALSGSIAFGGPPPRTELPAPMAAGLRDVPRSLPAPVDVPRRSPSEFDARSFFDTLDRSSYASGGKTMPQKPRDQAIAAALDTARRYGGRTGYAEGGTPSMLDTAERINSPGRGTLAPIYDWLGSAASAVNADLNRDQHPLDAVLDPSARKFLGGLGTSYGLEAPASAAKVLSKGIDYARGRPEATDINTADVVNTALIASPLGKAMTHAPKATGAFAGLGAMALPADASPPQVAEGSVLDRLIEQRKALIEQRAKDQAERDLQSKGDPKRGIKPGVGKNHEGATKGMERIDEQIAKLDGMIEKELTVVQKRKFDESPEGVLLAEKAKKAFEEQQAEKERGRPVRERLLPGFLQDAVIPAATYAGYRLTKGIVGKQNAEHQGAINRFLEAQGANDVPAMALAQAQLQKLNNPGFWSSLGQGTKTALSALLPAEIRLGEAAIDLSKGPETRAFKEQSERLHDPYLLAADVGLPLLSSGLAYGAGSKMAKPYVERSLGKAIADSPNPYSGSGPLAAGYGRALELSESLGRLRQTGPASPAPAATPLRSSPIEEAVVVPPTPAPRLAERLPDYQAAAIPPPAPVVPANQAALPAPTQSPVKLPRGWSEVPNGRGSKFHDAEGNWAVLPKRLRKKDSAKSSTDGKGNKPGEGEFKRGGVVSRALDIARRYARGGRVLVGPVVGATGGRTDALPVDVPAGAFVIPSDVVSFLGENNSEAGFLKLTKAFGKPLARQTGDSVPIKISHGEFVVTPEQVAKLGNGDMDQGHKVLDQLVLKLRAEHIKSLQSLPPPATS